MWRIYISSAAGLDFTGLSYPDSQEEEAKKECEKLNEQNDSVYCNYVCKHS